MKLPPNTSVGTHCSISPEAHIGDHVTIGNRVTVFPGVEIGNGARILDGAIVGRLTIPTKAVHRPAPSKFLQTVIGAGSVIGCNCVLYTGVQLGPNCLLADGVSIREGVSVGHEALLGRYVTINYDARIGARTRIMDFTHITGNSDIGEDCFISIHVSTANDNDVYVRRLGLPSSASDDFAGPRLGKYVVVGAGAVLNPGIYVGDGSLVASGAVVTRSIPAWSIAMGVPARKTSAIPASWRELVLSAAEQRGQKLEES